MYWPAVGFAFALFFLVKLDVEDPVWPMTVRKHLSDSFPLDLHIALYLLPLVVLPLSLQLVLISHCAACPERAGDVACKLHGKAAGGETRGRFAVSKILKKACVLVIRGLQRCAFPESEVSVVAGVATSFASAVQRNACFVE